MTSHPPDPLLWRLLSQQDKDDPVGEHVSGCARCSRRLDTLRTTRPADHAIYDNALYTSVRRLHEMQSYYAKERAEAAGLVAELLRHPMERRLMLVRNHRRFHTWGVLERLLENSRMESMLNPRTSHELATLALALSDHLDETFYGVDSINDMKGRAWAFVGNARRIGSDLPGAQEAFEKALVHLRRGTRDPWEHAICLDLKASLLRAQRHFDEALHLLNRALALFLAIGDRHHAGRTLVNMDNVLHHAGRPEEGIPLLYRALGLIDAAQDPKLLLIARHNLTDDLAEACRYMEAQRLLMQSRPLYRQFDEPWFRNRRIWVEAKIVRGLGQPDQAERLFLATRAGLVERGLPYDVALVSLDLAGLYAGQGRHAELKRLAAEMVPIFSSLQIHREAFAAFNLWHQAVLTEAAEAEMTAAVVAALRRARYDHPVSQDGL